MYIDSLFFSIVFFVFLRPFAGNSFLPDVPIRFRTGEIASGYG